MKTGDKFGKLTAITPTRGSASKQYWYFICDCGTYKEVRIDHVKSGRSQSCGCLQKEVASAQFKTFGLTKHPLRSVWTNMMTRCYNPNYHHYHRYGGRGIIVCERWHNFAAFIVDMSPRPEGDYTLDRINNDGNYEKENCRWATQVEQRNNRT